MNVDAGTMAPTEHGEVFVLDDGGEVDLDLGNYERYLNITLTRENNITTGKIYQHVIERERRGDYLGKTVQVVPHLTDAIQDWIERVARIPVDDTNEAPDVCIIELGGTVGDIESAPFIEAMRQLKRRAGKNNFLQVHVSLIPVIQGEQKTKPTQQAIRDVGRAGLVPDLIACRCDIPLEKGTIDKIAMFCQVEPEQVVAVHNVSSTYHVPLLLEKQGLVETIRNILKLDDIPKAKSLVDRGQRTWTEWKNLTSQQDRLFDTVSIVLVGKYTNLHDSYLSVIKSLEHSAMRCGKKLNLVWVDASNLEEQARTDDPAAFHKAWHNVCTANGILVPGGFGQRGTEGMIAAAKWARTNKTPYLGICLGMQIAVIEFARNVCGITGASSVELNEQCSDPLVIFMPEIDKTNLGGTMRLGLRPTLFQPGSEWSRLRQLYGEKLEIQERHRHRYEVNPEYIDRLAEAGLNFIGKDDKGVRMEIIELKDHPWYVGVQFHPEYLSRVLDPSKPYLGFVAAAAGCLEKVTEDMGKSAALVNGSAEASLVNGLNGVRI
ncbi:CTP synthase ura7 [Cadophora gregata]|uniref:CTP synthase ura7 n=1 Tax=Cadophora gregata TaxID=51156 RepID=UPI0026DAF532|nr:CTP synthase ura7 [Cadophora gregata]KAK0118658.1 CTP synthase ura7 [Cadophora gregata f. sp. sojae]KAK0125915.1 CTP synthase ura7 [Cadophora gregata]